MVWGGGVGDEMKEMREGGGEGWEERGEVGMEVTSYSM